MAVASAEANNPGGQSLSASEPIDDLPAVQSNTEMALEEDNENVISFRFKSLSKARQIQLIISVAAAISMMIALFLWSSEPNYQLLYGKLNEEAAGEIIPILDAQGIDYKLDDKTGELKVGASDVHSTRIMLAAQGLPKAEGSGFEILDEAQNFGTSQFMEKARYQRALEGEIARSIKGLSAVDSARVHLAIPRQSVFIREKKEASASVLVNLKQGKMLDESKIVSIVHLVASSVPDLDSSKVTVVDQKGNLLSKKELKGDMALSTAQFDYKRKLEEYYVQRIERILIPVIGFEGVRAEVETDVDFTSTEKTQESFNPDLPALRSEHVTNEESRGSDMGGVPGALTNQPPGTATVPETLPGGGKQFVGPVRKSSQETFNYELDKTISHIKQAPGILRRLSVAVVIDDKIGYEKDGTLIRTPYSPEVILQIENLIKDSVGFDVTRGDSINVVNTAFHSREVLPPKPPVPIWEQDWFIDIAKQIVGVLLILFFIVIVLRPVIRELTFKEEPEEIIEEIEEEPEIEESTEETGGLTLQQWEELGLSYDEYEGMLETLKELAADDPRIVAQVIRTWVMVDEDL